MGHPATAGTAASVSTPTKAAWDLPGGKERWMRYLSGASGRVVPQHDPLPTIKVHAIVKGDQEWIIKVMKARPARNRKQWSYVEAGFSCRFHGNTKGVYPFVNRDGHKLAWVEFPGGDANLRAAMDVALKHMIVELD